MENNLTKEIIEVLIKENSQEDILPEILNKIESQPQISKTEIAQINIPFVDQIKSSEFSQINMVKTQNNITNTAPPLTLSDEQTIEKAIITITGEQNNIGERV